MNTFYMLDSLDLSLESLHHHFLLEDGYTGHRFVRGCPCRSTEAGEHGLEDVDIAEGTEYRSNMG